MRDEQTPQDVCGETNLPEDLLLFRGPFLESPGNLTGPESYF